MWNGLNGSILRLQPNARSKDRDPRECERDDRHVRIRERVLSPFAANGPPDIPQDRIAAITNDVVPMTQGTHWTRRRIEISTAVVRRAFISDTAVSEASSSPTLRGKLLQDADPAR